MKSFLSLSAAAALLLAAGPALADGATSDQQQACVDAAAQSFGVMESEVQVTNSETSPDGQILVYINVRGDGATCTLGADGHVLDVSYGQ